MIDKKKNGVYYTPSFLAKFLINYIFEKGDFVKKISILEPSCGDGVFVNHLLEIDSLLLNHDLKLDLVEKNKDELDKVRKFTDNKNSENFKVQYYNEDYLVFQKKNKTKYDLIIGNPPYINKKLLNEKQIEICEEILMSAGFKISTIKNIWIAFLVSAVSILKDDGRICFVLPSEIMQVNHSKQLREYLLNEFDLIELFTFNELIFQGTEQDTVVIICTRKSKVKGLKLYRTNNVETLLASRDTLSVHIKQPVEEEKWTNYFLMEDELKRVRDLTENIKHIVEYCDASVGIVTAANNFFIVDDATVKKYQLGQLVSPIIKKSSFIPNTVRVTSEDLKRISDGGNATNFIVFGNQEITNYNLGIQSYLNEGIKRKIHERYKCKLRNKWYDVPSIWISEGMFFKRCHKYPKLIFNEAQVYATDSAYRIKMKKEYDIKSFIFSFYNSLTLLLTELNGRSYGGGVLELTPNEFKKLPIPYLSISTSEFDKLDVMLRDNIPIELILNYTNKIILEEQYGMCSKDIAFLNQLYKKLVNKRLKIKE